MSTEKCDTRIPLCLTGALPRCAPPCAEAGEVEADTSIACRFTVAGVESGNGLACHCTAPGVESGIGLTLEAWLNAIIWEAQRKCSTAGAGGSSTQNSRLNIKHRRRRPRPGAHERREVGGRGEETRGGDRGVEVQRRVGVSRRVMDEGRERDFIVRKQCRALLRGRETAVQRDALLANQPLAKAMP